MVPVGCVVQLGPGPVFELEGGAAISGLVISVARVGGDGAEARGVGSGDLSDSHEFSGTYIPLVLSARVHLLFEGHLPHLHGGVCVPCLFVGH